MTTQLNWSAAVFAMLGVAALPAMAASTTQWAGSATGNWNDAANWSSGVPTTNHYAKFTSPYATPYVVTVDDVVDVYAFSLSSSRTADTTFTGSGTIQTHRNSSILSGGTSRMIFDVDVVNAASANQSIYGNSVFKKRLDIGSAYSFNLGDSNGNKASVSLEDNAAMTVLGMYLYADSSLSLSGSSTLNLMGDSYLRVYKPGASLNIGDDAVVNGKYINVYSGASMTISSNAQITLTRDLVVNPGGTLTVSGNPVINLRTLKLPFSMQENTDEEWTMNGGEFRATTAGSSYCVNLPYTNATKTISGTGTLCVYQLAVGYSSNLVFRLMGPDAYLGYHYVSAERNTTLEIGSGSTIGVWGQNINIKNGKTRFTGSATLDTTDYLDKRTARTITINSLYNCDGTLTVKGLGSVIIAPTHVNQPNLNVTVQDNATLNTQSYSFYALNDVVLKDNAHIVCGNYLGQKNTSNYVKSLAMDDNSTLAVKRYAQVSGDVALSGHASAVIRNENNDSGATLSCANLSLSGDASLSVTGTVAAATLSMAGNAHFAFRAGSPFSTDSTFGNGNWSMEITIPSGYAAGLRPIVTGASFGSDFVDHVTLLGDTAGWSAMVIDGTPVLYKASSPSGVEWIGQSTSSDNWSDPANWNDGTLPTSLDYVAFGGLDRPTPYNNLLNTASGLVFRASAGPFTLSGASEKLTLVANTNGRGSATEANAVIVSHSGFRQTVAMPLEFPGDAYVLSDGGGEVALTQGFRGLRDWQCFIVGGDVAIGGTCSAGILSFKNSLTAKPSCLRLLPGCDFTLRSQGIRSISEANTYIGHFFIEEGATLTIKKGECSFYYGALENVVNGVLNVKTEGTGLANEGRLVSSLNEQYYTGTGSIYADMALSGKFAACLDHYINFGGTLSLYMNGDWNTASYYLDGSTVRQSPNCPTRFRMTDGTTLGATANWTHGPRADAYNEVAATITPADRTSVMTGTVTVDTQDPEDASIGHTIIFVDPLDASDATVVKTGAGLLAFNEPTGYASQISNLVVNAGSVAFASAPTFTGKLTLSSTDADFRVLGLPSETGWSAMATAAQIAGPDGQTEWTADDAKHRYRVVTSGGVSRLECSRDAGMMLLFL